MREITITKQVAVVGSYDVVVVGGGPAGVFAAIAAAREGAKVALVERFGFLGGMATAGLVMPLSVFTYNQELVIGGIPWEFIHRLVDMGGGYIEHPLGNVAFDPELYKLCMQRMVEEAGIALYMNSYLSGCTTEQGAIRHIVIENKNGSEALAARVFLLIAYPAQMTSFSAPQIEGAADAFSGATPLAAAKAQMVTFAGDNLLEMFTGTIGGSFGEVSALALLLGFVYLLVRRVITWHIPVATLGTMALFGAIYALCALGGGMATLYFPAFHLLAGGALLGSIFMATDYVTSPMTTKGMVIYGVGIGAITMCIRLWGAYPEGMSFAILIMNAMVPLINKYVKPKRFGAR